MANVSKCVIDFLVILISIVFGIAGFPTAVQELGENEENVVAEDLEHLSYGWGDSYGGRRDYLIAEIEADALGSRIVFNSISDGAYTDDNGVLHRLGDERNFVCAREYGTQDIWASNGIQVEDGKEYIISLYVHNNSPLGMKAIAKNVKVRFYVPGSAGKYVSVFGYIESPNAEPSKYWDSVYFYSDQSFHIEAISNSGLWESNGQSSNSILSNEILSSRGTYVGYNELDGSIPGCYQYSGYASIRVRAVFDAK